MTINQILDDEDDDKEEKNIAAGKDDAAEEEDVIIEEEGGDEEERAAKTKKREDEEGLTEEEKREARRARKKRQKERARLAKEHDKSMIAGLQDTVAQLNAKINKLSEKGEEDELQKLHTMKRNADNRAQLLKAQIKKATEDGVGDIAELTDQLVNVRADLRQIEGMETAATEERKKNKEQEEGSTEETQRELLRVKAQTINNNVQVFASRNDWYVMSDDDTDADEDDIEDSERVRELDKQLTERGSDPSTRKHWQELENMMKEELPHRFEKQDKEEKDHPARANGKRRPAMTGGSGRGRSSQETEGYRLSKERVEAMKDAGIWDDPVRKKRAIDRYKAYDKQNSSARN